MAESRVEECAVRQVGLADQDLHDDSQYVSGAARGGLSGAIVRQMGDK
jgi:hypothetical protein